MGNIVNHNVMIGAAGTATTLIVGHFDYLTACIAGVITVGILVIRFRKEWRHRND